MERFVRLAAADRPLPPVPDNRHYVKQAPWAVAGRRPAARCSALGRQTVACGPRSRVMAPAALRERHLGRARTRPRSRSRGHRRRHRRRVGGLRGNGAKWRRIVSLTRVGSCGSRDADGGCRASRPAPRRRAGRAQRAPDGRWRARRSTPRRRHPHRLAGARHRQPFGPLVIDTAVTPHRVDVSFTQKATDRLSRSRSIRSCAFSARSSARSARSSVVSPSRSPRSTRA